MRSDWDMPRPANDMPQSQAPETQDGQSQRNTPPRQDGMMDPAALVGLLARNALTIVLIAAVLTAIGVAALLFYPFPYKATAIVLADPRDQQVTLQQDVLPAIGADAAVLESMVQIVKSDGFLLATMEGLGLISDDLSRTDRLKDLAKFRKKLTAERKGATYLVEISYAAADREEAARIANGVADAFAQSQNQSRSVATENAAKSLASRLVELRAQLNESEQAVAQFKAENGIVFVDQNNTLQMRQLTELSQQLALAKNATEEARARYEELKNGGSISISPQQTGENSQLSFLRQQRAELAQQMEQQQQVYGPRHPRIQQTQQALRGLDSQIAQERQLLAQQLKATLDVAAAKQAELEKQIAAMRTGVGLSEGAQVKLDALEREAAADREIYQQFLARNKQTDELALLVEDNVRVVSEAVPPLRSTRPSLVIVGPALAVFSLAIAAFASIGRNFGSVVRPAPAEEPAERPVMPRGEQRTAAARSVERPRRPGPAPAYEPVSLLDVWSGETTGDRPNSARTLRARHDRLRAAHEEPETLRGTRRSLWRRAG